MSEPVFFLAGHIPLWTSRDFLPPDILTLLRRPLEPTDLINLDITVYALHPLAPASPRHAYHGDNSQTICLPDVDAAGRELVEVTKEALEIGIKVCGPDVPFREIGRAIE